MTTFVDWLFSEMENRNWTQADLARAAHLSRGAIGNIIREERNPSPDSLHGIAKAFSLPPEVVFRKAGLLPPEREAVHGMAELREVYSLLPESDRQELLEIARLKLERQEARKKRSPLARPAEG